MDWKEIAKRLKELRPDAKESDPAYRLAWRDMVIGFADKLENVNFSRVDFFDACGFTIEWLGY